MATLYLSCDDAWRIIILFLPPCKHPCLMSDESSTVDLPLAARHPRPCIRARGLTSHKPPPVTHRNHMDIAY